MSKGALPVVHSGRMADMAVAFVPHQHPSGTAREAGKDTVVHAFLGRFVLEVVQSSTDSEPTV